MTSDQNYAKPKRDFKMLHDEDILADPDRRQIETKHMDEEAKLSFLV